MTINNPSVMDADVQLDLDALAHPHVARRMGKNDLLTTDRNLAFLMHGSPHPAPRLRSGARREGWQPGQVEQGA
ncbi:MAG: hypothetical protein NTW51_14470 [Cyanobacteria bacterium]|nr:hypothetical protein [Cyanobacteriota bacterium]